MKSKFLKLISLSSIFLLFCPIVIVAMEERAHDSQDRLASEQSGRVKWPVLNSTDDIHKIIISSMINDERCEYAGKFFTTKTDSRNAQLTSKADQITNALLNPTALVTVNPVPRPSIYKNFTKRCAYEVRINSRKIAIFYLHVVQNLPSNQPVVQTRNTTHSQNGDVSHIGNFQRDLVKIGHGAFGKNFAGHVSDDTISTLIAQTKNNPILNQAYKIIEAADFVNIQDPILLAHYIKHNRNHSITGQEVINAISNDAAIIEKVRRRVNQLDLGGSFADQIKHLVPNGILDRAIKFIRQNPEICEGIIPGQISNYHGCKMLVLRTALFYIARVQQDLSEEFKSLLKKLGGFFAVKPYNDNVIKNLLNQTYITIDGKLYVPANSYVLFADATNEVKQEVGNLPITFEPGRRTQTFNMHFGDCTGFVSEIVRNIRPDLTWFKKNRFKSRDLEIAYDVMIKEQTDAYQYNCLGRTRDLTRAEINRINNEFMGTAKLTALKKAFKPVLKRDEIKAGDIVIYRQRPNGVYSTGTGHGVIVVDPMPSRTNPNLITVVECNIGSSSIHGYGWRNDNISSRGIWETRVLRFRNV